MVISAYFETTATEMGKQRATRRKLQLEVRGAHATRSDIPVIVHNISETGMLIECAAELAVDDRLDLDLPHAGVVNARLIWASGQFYGCQFDVPISSGALSAAQLQSTLARDDEAERVPGETVEVVDPAAAQFGANLRHLRVTKGLSQLDIANHLGVSAPSISGWENGRVRPKRDRLVELAGLLEVPVSQLLVDTRPDQMHEVIGQGRDMIARATGLSPDRIRIIVEF